LDKIILKITKLLIENLEEQKKKSSKKNRETTWGETKSQKIKSTQQKFRSPVM